MDVTPQVINEVEFHQKMRGYDPDEVDDFLERVAVAVEQLQLRVRDAEQRASTAERRAATEVRGPKPAVAKPDETEETETIRRTLVLAQRTADAAVKEAQEEAQRKLQEAQEQSQRLIAEAQERARRVVIEAESEARKTADDTRQRLVKEIIALEETRDSLRADHGILERHLDEQRLRLRSSIGDLQRLLDDPGRLRAATAPDLSAVTRPSLVDDVLAEVSDDAGADVVETDAANAVSSETTNAPAAVEDTDDDVIDLDRPLVPIDDEVEQRPITGGVTYTPPDDADGSSAFEPGNLALATDLEESIDEDAWRRFASGSADGPPTMAVSVADAGGDAYMTELRKAMLEDTSASTVDPGEHRARTRFGRRR